MNLTYHPQFVICSMIGAHYGSAFRYLRGMYHGLSACSDAILQVCETEMIPDTPVIKSCFRKLHMWVGCVYCVEQRAGLTVLQGESA